MRNIVVILEDGDLDGDGLPNDKDEDLDGDGKVNHGKLLIRYAFLQLLIQLL